MKFQMIRKSAIVAIAALAIPFAVTPAANAEARATGQSTAPYVEGDHLRASANIVQDCAGTMGCWNYVKIDRRKGWFGGWEHMGGNWKVGSGWHDVTGRIAPGCHTYRVTVMSYNDKLVEESSSGQGTSTTTGVNKRIETDWSGAPSRICH